MSSAHQHKPQFGQPKAPLPGNKQKYIRAVQPVKESKWTDMAIYATQSTNLFTLQTEQEENTHIWYKKKNKEDKGKH